MATAVEFELGKATSQEIDQPCCRKSYPLRGVPTRTSENLLVSILAGKTGNGIPIV